MRLVAELAFFEEADVDSKERGRALPTSGIFDEQNGSHGIAVGHSLNSRMQTPDLPAYQHTRTRANGYCKFERCSEYHSKRLTHP